MAPVDGQSEQMKHNRRSSRLRAVRWILLLLLLLAITVFVFEYTRPFRPDNSVDDYVDRLIGRDWVDFEDPDLVYIEMPADEEHAEKFAVRHERSDYVDGTMILILPSLQLNKAVSDGTSKENLNGHPGLFPMSDMPGEGDCNVSIAGHRNRSNFYYLDRVGEGDRAYLVYDGYIYTYLYSSRTEVLPTQWDIIGKQGFSCCTLITCTPIRVASHRMVVRFELENIEADSEERRNEIIDWEQE
jgi:LPXTG-site transpeptidase (sortase) family protein